MMKVTILRPHQNLVAFIKAITKPKDIAAHTPTNTISEMGQPPRWSKNKYMKTVNSIMAGAANHSTPRRGDSAFALFMAADY